MKIIEKYIYKGIEIPESYIEITRITGYPYDEADQETGDTLSKFGAVVDFVRYTDDTKQYVLENFTKEFKNLSIESLTFVDIMTKCYEMFGLEVK